MNGVGVALNHQREWKLRTCLCYSNWQ